MLSGEIIDAATGTVCVDGDKYKSLTAHAGVPFSEEEEHTMFFSSPSYKTRGWKPYNPEDNSITIGAGAAFPLGNGNTLLVGDHGVTSVGNRHNNWLINGLNALIHFADQQWSSDRIYSQSMPLVLDFLRQQGVDTSREFIINGTHCELVNGEISEVGNTHVVPNAIYQKTLKRYEEQAYQSLAGDFDTRTLAE